MADKRPSLADILPEPADGTRLAVHDHDDSWTLIVRDDARARRGPAAQPEERWFDCADWQADPIDWACVMRYARDVHAVAPLPLTASPARACRHCGMRLQRLDGRYYSPVAPVFFCADDRKQRHEPAPAPAPDPTPPERMKP